MNRKLALRAVLAVAALAGAGTAASYGQSSDALVEKLVSKGILTTQEAADLKKEADQGFSKALRAKNGLPEWVTAFKINGDFRGRLDSTVYDESVKVPGAGSAVDRYQWRYRLRLGMVATIKDNLELGMRLSSDDPKSGTPDGSPIGANTTMTRNGSKKYIYLDQAYGKWTPLHTANWTGGLTLGKMEQPFNSSDLIWDPDYTPEGMAETVTYQFNDRHSLKFTGGQFALNELKSSSNDSYLFGGQLRWDAKWAPKWQSTLGAAWYGIKNPASLDVYSAAGTFSDVDSAPDFNAGNTRTADATAPTAKPGKLRYQYNPFIVDAGVTYSLPSMPLYKGPFPIKLAGDFVDNPAVSEANKGFSAGLTFGKAGKKSTWEVAYRYRYLERDAWYEELADSDAGGYYSSGFGATLPYAPASRGYASGTNVKGHVIKAGYSPFDCVTLNATLFITSLINNPGQNAGYESQVYRFQLDACLKF